MPHSYTYDSIILKAYDAGEADRFLMLFTRERGLLSARARAVRKLKSKLGGSLLPFQHVTIGLHEGGAGFIVTSAYKQPSPDLTSTKSFLSAEHGVELLLTLLHDDEPLPEIFDLTLGFLDECRHFDKDPVQPFTIELLKLLGLIPEPKNLPHSKEEFSTLCAEIISEHGNRTQKVPKILSSIAL